MGWMALVREIGWKRRVQFAEPNILVLEGSSIDRWIYIDLVTGKLLSATPMWYVYCDFPKLLDVEQVLQWLAEPEDEDDCSVGWVIDQTLERGVARCTVRQVTVASCLKDRARPVNIYIDQRSALEEAIEINCGILEDLNAELTELENQLIVVKSQVDELTTITNGQQEMYDRLGENSNEVD